MKMRSLAAALLLCLGVAGGAEAQTFVVTSCPSVTVIGSAGQRGLPYAIDIDGNICTSSAGGGGGLSVTDQAPWTQATSPFTPNGGVFNDTATLSSGEEGTQRLTTKRAGIVDVDTTGNALYTAITAPVPNPATASAWGLGATGASVPSSGQLDGCRGQNAEATAVTNGQLAGVACDLVGKQITLPYSNPENFVSGLTAAMTATTSTSLIAAPAGSLRNYVTDIYCVNSHATVSTFVNIQDGSGGTTIYQGYAAAVGGGFGRSFTVALKQPTVATALFVANVTTGANVVCNAIGYKGI